MLDVSPVTATRNIVPKQQAKEESKQRERQKEGEAEGGREIEEEGLLDSLPAHILICVQEERGGGL